VTPTPPLPLESRLATAAVAEHGEGPTWDARAGEIRWVDMPRGLVRRLALADARADAVPEAVRVADFVAVIRPRVVGGWIACTRDAILLTDDAFAIERRIPVPMGPEERWNDGTAAPDGTFYVGTMALDGRGRLLRLHPDGRLDTVLTGLRISNGIAPTPDGARMLHVDSMEHRIDVYDLDADGMHDRRTFVDLADVDGEPDGIAVDAGGGVWVAMWGGRCVRGFDADGAPVAVIDVPTIQPSACAFVGEDLATLAITSSAQGLTPGADALAGALFLAEPGVAGLPPLPFGG